MWILTRRIGEAVVMPELGVVVRILAVCGNQVRIGVSAPSAVPLVRPEMGHKVQACRAVAETAGLVQRTAERP
jgi:carbon storage regulator